MVINQDQFLNIVRGITNAAGGYMLAKGWVNDSSSAMFSGLIMNVAMISWGLFVHSPAQVLKAAEIVKEKGVL